MNKHLNEAIYELGKADALIAAIEGMYMDFDLLPEEQEKADRGGFLLYCLWDAIKRARTELNEYTAECKIVDVIQAAREANSN